MTLDPTLVHPSLAPVADALVRHADLSRSGLPEPQRLVAETLVALLGSARAPAEMRGYAGELNAALDVPDSAPLLDALRRARNAARGFESARSGMAGDIMLDELDLALDDLYTAIHGEPKENPQRRKWL